MKTVEKLFKQSKAIIALVFVVLTLNGCSKDDNFDDNVPDYANAIIQSFKVGTKYAEINHTIGTITMTLPAGSNLAQVTPEIRIPDGSTVTPASGGTFNFSNGPLEFKVVSSDGANRKYTVNLAVYGDPKILSFGIGTNAGVINDALGTITVQIGSQDGNLNNLAPNFTISEGTTVDIASGVSRDFTSPKVYTILSNNGYTAKQYTVTVTQIAAPSITSFVVNGVTAIIDNNTNTILATLPLGSVLSSVTPVITLPTGQTVSPASGTTQNFSSGPIQYTVTNTEGLTIVYSVTLQTIAATKYAFLGVENDVNSLVDDDAKAAAIWMQTTYGANFKYIKINDISAVNIADVKVAMLYYLTPAESAGFSATSSDVSTLLPLALRTGQPQANVLKSWVKAGGDMLVAGDANPFIFSLGRVPANFSAPRAPSNYVYSEFGCSGSNGCVDTNKPADDIWGLGMRDSNNSGNRRGDAIFNGLTFDGPVGGEYLSLQNSSTREVRLIWWQHFDNILTPSCCGQDAALHFENTLQATKYGSLRHIGDSFGYGAVEFKRTDLTNSGEFDTQIASDYRGHIFTIQNSIVGYEWDSNGTLNQYQNNIKLFTQNILNYLYQLNND